MRYMCAVIVGASLVLAGCSVRAGVDIEPQVGIAESDNDAPGSDRVWVCHQDRWQEVGAPAANAHRRHGDRVSSTAQEARATPSYSNTNGSPIANRIWPSKPGGTPYVSERSGNRH